MASQWNEDEEKKINKYNGQYVTATLSFLGSKATEIELLKHIVNTTSQPHEIVEQELNRILRTGVDSGFLVKICNEYLLPTEQNVQYEIDADAKTPRRTEAEEVEDCDSDEWEDLDGEKKLDEVLNDYLNVLEELMQIQCRLFRNKLLDKIIDVVVDEKKRKNQKCGTGLTDQILHITTIPEQHVDAFTKSKITNFYSTAFELINEHNVRTQLLRYTFLSLDKHIMDVNLHKFEAEKQCAIKKYISEVAQLEKGDCEQFRTVYINHLLNEVVEALQQGTQFASELFTKLNIQDGAALSCTLKNFVQNSFVLGKLGSCPIDAYFKFLSNLKTKAPKRKAGKSRGRGARKRKRC